MPSQVKAPEVASVGESGFKKPYFSDDFIHEVRREFLLQAENEEDFETAYLESDLATIQIDDWFVRRFLKWKPTTKAEAVKSIQEALRWRAEVKIDTWKDSDFPAEFYQVGTLFAYLPDKEQNNVIIARLRSNKRDPTGSTIVDKLVKNYFVFQFEKIVSQYPNRGINLIFDCYNASLSNVDLGMARYIINVLNNYYSGVISNVCLYELPWIFNTVWGLVKSWLDDDSKRIVRFLSAKDITDVIDPGHLPEYMGGKGTKDFRVIPKNVLSFKNHPNHFGIAIKDVKKITDHYKKLAAVI